MPAVKKGVGQFTLPNLLVHQQARFPEPFPASEDARQIITPTRFSTYTTFIKPLFIY